MSGSPTLSFAGSSLCSGSALLGVIQGDNPALVVLGIAGGIALGSVGIVQKIRDNEAKRLRTRLESVESELDQSKERARERIDSSLDKISELTHRLKEVEQLAAERAEDLARLGRKVAQKRDCPLSVAGVPACERPPETPPDPAQP